MAPAKSVMLVLGQPAVAGSGVRAERYIILTQYAVRNRAHASRATSHEPRRSLWYNGENLGEGGANMSEAAAVPVVLATTNRGKVEEFRRILAGLPGPVLAADEAGL